MQDGYMPHKAPKLDEGDSWLDVIAWICQACGEGVSEYGSEKRTDCTIDWRGLKMNGRQKVMKEPPMGSVVVDINGSAWQRTPNGWTIAGSDNSWSYTWKKVVEQELYTLDNGLTVTAEWKPVLGDPRLPLIVYIPHEELIFEEESEEESEEE